MSPGRRSVSMFTRRELGTGSAEARGRRASRSSWRSEWAGSSTTATPGCWRSSWDLWRMATVLCSSLSMCWALSPPSSPLSSRERELVVGAGPTVWSVPLLTLSLISSSDGVSARWALHTSTTVENTTKSVRIHLVASWMHSLISGDQIINIKLSSPHNLLKVLLLLWLNSSSLLKGVKGLPLTWKYKTKLPASSIFSVHQTTVSNNIRHPHLALFYFLSINNINLRKSERVHVVQHTIFHYDRNVSIKKRFHILSSNIESFSNQFRYRRLFFSCISVTLYTGE